MREAPFSRVFLGLAACVAIGCANDGPPSEPSFKELKAPLNAPVPTLGQFVLLSSNSATFGQRCIVTGGDIGVAAGNGLLPNTLTGEIDSRLGSGEVLLAPRVVLGERAVTGEIGANTISAPPSAVTGPRSAFVAPPAVPTPGGVTPGINDITVGAGQISTRAAGRFRDVTVTGTLNLSGGVYEVRRLILNPNGRVVAQADATVRIQQTLSVADRGQLNVAGTLTPRNLRLMVAGADLNDNSVTLGPDAHMSALLVAARTVRGADRAILTGSIAARQIILGNDARVTFNGGLECASNAACDDGNPCTADACVDAKCVRTPAPNGTACSDGNGCTQSDTCQAGACTGASPVVCQPLDQCHDVGVCDRATGACSNPTKPDGTTCSDGSLCTQTDVCHAGSCAGTPLVCSAPDQCHDAGVCDESSGVCTNPPKPDGAPCSDGNQCTTQDACQAGQCTGGDPIVCMAQGQCHDPGVCNPQTGMCSNPASPDGTACNDGSACTQADVCQAGSCQAGNPVLCGALDQCHVAGICNPQTGACSNPASPDGTACNDGSACTQTDVCQAGSCQAGNPVTCSALDQCHVAGVCNPQTGTCSNPASPDGTACNDGSACTQTDVCRTGSCQGGNPVMCSALDQCHVTGVCDPATGVCSDPAAPDGTLCNDNDPCSLGDACSSGNCSPGDDFAVTEFNSGLAQPRSIVDGPDGNLWFVAPETTPGARNASMARITTAGVVTSQTVLRDLGAMLRGPDDKLWVSERLLNGLPALARFDTTLRAFASDFTGINAFDLAASNDGGTPIVWFTSGSSVGRVTPAGMLLPAVPTFFTTRAITAATPAPKTLIWFTEANGGGFALIGRLDFPNLQQFSVTTPGPLVDIVEGPDGGIWFTDPAQNQIGRMPPSGGKAVKFDLPNSASDPHSIIGGPDGNLWISLRGANKIARMSPSGEVMEVCLPTAASEPTQVAIGPDGNLWFTETASGKIGRVQLTP